MKKILFVLLALVAGFSYDADAQFLKKLSKGLEKVSKEAEKVQKLLDPNAQQQDKKETESKQLTPGRRKYRTWCGMALRSAYRASRLTRAISACRTMRRCRTCTMECSPCIVRAKKVNMLFI